MRLKTAALITAMVLVFIGSGIARAEITKTQVTINTYEDAFGQIDGDYVVWQGRGNLPDALYDADDWEIFLYNTATGASTQLTDNDNVDDLNPRTDGRYVVWWSDKPTGAEVWLYDIGTGTPIQISPSDGHNHYLPVIASGRVAWVRYTLGDVTSREIFFYDVLNPPALQITDNSVDDSAPRISDQYLAWIQTDSDQNSKVYVRDLSSGEIQEAANPSVWGMSPQKDGSLSVSLSHDGEDWEVIIKDTVLKYSESITDNNVDDRHPRLGANRIVWAAGEGKMSEIFLAVYTSLVCLTPGHDAVLSRLQPPTFTWASVGYDKFKVEFSEDPDFSTANSIALPLGKDDWLSETSFTPTKGQWELVGQIGGTDGRVYWRVKGKDTEENVAFNDPLAFTLVAEEAADLTTGMRGVTGDGDSGGLCFIGTAARSSW